MKQLENRADIEDLVNFFYTKIQTDGKIGFFFNDVAKVDWSAHLPKMYSFWETILLGNNTYKGNPMAVHFPINALEAIEKHHFDRWISLWESTVKENFTGEIADLAVYKAKNIANLMAYKMETARRLS